MVSALDIPVILETVKLVALIAASAVVVVFTVVALASSPVGPKLYWPFPTSRNNSAS